MKRIPLFVVVALLAAACGNNSQVDDKSDTSTCDGLLDGDACDYGDGLCMEITRSGAECEYEEGLCWQGECVPADEWPPEDPGDDPEDPGDDPEDPGDDPEDPGDDPEDPGDDPEDPGDDPEDPEDPPLCEEDACDDGNECTIGGCEDDECVFYPVDDGQLCGQGGVCDAGECVALDPPDPITVEQDLYCKLGLLPLKIPMTMTVTPEGPFIAGEPTEVTTSVTAELSKWIAKLAIKTSHHHKAKVTLDDAAVDIRVKGSEEYSVGQDFEDLPRKVYFEDHRGKPKTNVIDGGMMTHVITPNVDTEEVSFKISDVSGNVSDVPVFKELSIPGSLHCYFGHGEKARFEVIPTND